MPSLGVVGWPITAVFGPIVTLRVPDPGAGARCVGGVPPVPPSHEARPGLAARWSGVRLVRVHHRAHGGSPEPRRRVPGPARRLPRGPQGRGSLGPVTFVAGLAACLAFLFGVSTELFATATFFAVIASVVALIGGERRTHPVLKVGLLIVLSYAIVAELWSPFVSDALKSEPDQTLRVADETSVDLLSFVVPRRQILVDPHAWGATSRCGSPAAAEEDAAYVGIAMLVLLAAFAVTERRRRGRSRSSRSWGWCGSSHSDRCCISRAAARPGCPARSWPISPAQARHRPALPGLRVARDRGDRGALGVARPREVRGPALGSGRRRRDCDPAAARDRERHRRGSDVLHRRHLERGPARRGERVHDHGPWRHRAHVAGGRRFHVRAPGGLRRTGAAEVRGQPVVPRPVDRPTQRLRPGPGVPPGLAPRAGRDGGRPERHRRVEVPAPDAEHRDGAGLRGRRRHGLARPAGRSGGRRPRGRRDPGRPRPWGRTGPPVLAALAHRRRPDRGPGRRANAHHVRGPRLRFAASSTCKPSTPTRAHTRRSMCWPCRPGTPIAPTPSCCRRSISRSRSAKYPLGRMAAAFTVQPARTYDQPTPFSVFLTENGIVGQHVDGVWPTPAG